MTAACPVVAHIIVGSKPEPYLAAALESIADVCDFAVVNDNSAQEPSIHTATLGHSRLAKSGKMKVARSRFSDFASARNLCLDETPAELRHGWGLFVDADEVHGEELAAMAALLPQLHARVDSLDGYSRHFVGSFNWWIAIQRRMCFFRLGPEHRWRGRIHERLLPSRQNAVVPAVWFHYGHVVLPQQEAEKSRLYGALGQPGPVPDDEMIRQATPERVWWNLLPKAIRFRGEHPSAMHEIIATLSRERFSLFAEVDRLAAQQRPSERIANFIRRMNFERLLASRRLEAKVRWGWPNRGDARYA